MLEFFNGNVNVSWSDALQGLGAGVSCAVAGGGIVRAYLQRRVVQKEKALEKERQRIEKEIRAEIIYEQVSATKAGRENSHLIELIEILHERNQSLEKVNDELQKDLVKDLQDEILRLSESKEYWMRLAISTQAPIMESVRLSELTTELLEEVLQGPSTTSTPMPQSDPPLPGEDTHAAGERTLLSPPTEQLPPPDKNLLPKESSLDADNLLDER